MKDKKLRILVVEHDTAYADLMEHELHKVKRPFISKRVETKAGLIDALDKFKPDIILSAYSLPSYDGLSALAIVQEKFPDAPFIFVSGTLGEELAIEALKKGATDYVLKQNISRLAPVVHRALKENEERQKRRKAEMELRASEERYDTLFQRAAEGIMVVEIGTMKILYVNPAICKMLGYTEKEFSKLRLENIHPREELDKIEAELSPHAQNKETLVTTIPCLRKDGTVIYTDVSVARAEIDGRECGIGFLTDITERKQAQERIRKLYDFQTVIRETNQNLLRVTDEPALFQTVCDLLIKLKDIRLVWIGLWEKDISRIMPVSHAGAENGYFDLLKDHYGGPEADTCPMSRAVKINKPVVINDIESSTLCPPRLRKETLKRGYASSAALSLVHEGEIVGILCLYAGKKDVFGDEEIVFLEEVANDIAVGIKSLRLDKKVEDGYKEVKETLEGTIEVISLIGELRDPYTAGHQRRVSQLACSIAKKMNIDSELIEGIRIAGLLHDIGKIAIPSDILNKPVGLTMAEREILRSHSNNGYKILERIKFSCPVAKTVLQHHERINGSGYPSGLSGDDIITEAKILGVADVVEAMDSHRPYRPALGIGKALEEINANSGILYDPAVVDACLKVFKDGFVFK